MMKVRSLLIIGVFLLILASSLPAAASVQVVASTTWVGAMAEAAGVSDVTVLAPLDLRHPAEYDFRPNDIILALEADYLLWAGYEPFIRKLVEAAEIPEEKLIKVYTNNSPPLLKEQVANLAEVFGTADAYAKWEQQLTELSSRLQAGAAKNGVDEIPVAVQAHQKVWVEWLGYDVVAAFGPGEVTPGKIGEVINAQPAVIIDNWHSAQGEGFAGDGREYVSLINFPGPFETNSLLDVLTYNGKALGLID